MKIKLNCRDGVEQTHHINPSNISRLKEKHKKDVN